MTLEEELKDVDPRFIHAHAKSGGNVHAAATTLNELGLGRESSALLGFHHGLLVLPMIEAPSEHYVRAYDAARVIAQTFDEENPNTVH